MTAALIAAGLAAVATLARAVMKVRMRLDATQRDRILTFEHLLSHAVTVYLGGRDFLPAVTGRVVGIIPEEDTLVLETPSGRHAVILSRIVAVDDALGNSLANW